MKKLQRASKTTSDKLHIRVAATAKKMKRNRPLLAACMVGVVTLLLTLRQNRSLAGCVGVGNLAGDQSDEVTANISSAITSSRVVIEQPEQQHEEAQPEQQLLPYGDTTVVITTNLIASHPSIGMINNTIQSCFQHLVGLHPKAPIIIAADFVRNGTSPEDTARFDGFLRNLLQEYGPRISILVAPENRGLNWNMYHATQFVETEFMYVLQHDMPFCRDIDHTNSIKSMKEYPNDLRMIRFPLHYMYEIRGLWDRRPCFGKPTPVDYVNGLNFTKTPGWSDNNHLTTKKYYEDMFLYDIPPDSRTGTFMEQIMHRKATKDCDRYGPHLYGGIGSPHVILHLDGRFDGRNSMLAGFPPKHLWSANKEIVEKMKQEMNTNNYI